ncbi:flagellar FlbD family protein [Nocardioides sp.]|uniref:flagellar FlbD family protein n=1 Tax=Nocardioides sp. TaxID=35761 RepID=UPI0035121C13
MISLTRLSGSVFAINSDLIERIDATPDTVITLIGGTKYVVAESLDDVVAVVRRHRAEVLALGNHYQAYYEAQGYDLGLDATAVPPRPSLSLVRRDRGHSPEVSR